MAHQVDPAAVDLDVVLAALANRHRRAIVHLVGLRPWSISRLADERGLSLPAIHKHLAILEGAGLVVRHKRGRTTFLTIGRAPLASLQAWLGDFHSYWGSDEATFDNYAEHLGFDPSTDRPAGRAHPQEQP
jgi:DNA-binding transcriptional ArsR family regulator